MKVFLGLGSNLGDRRDNLSKAVYLLARSKGVKLLARSSLWESAPIGPAQPKYLNAAVEIEATLSPMELLAGCKTIERALGREPGGQRWGPRSADLDILLADEIIDEPKLKVPHRELHRRAFALLPLCELAPAGLIHPVLSKTLEELLAAVAGQDVRRVGEFDDARYPLK